MFGLPDHDDPGALRGALVHLTDVLDLKVAFELWDGSLAPASADPHSLRLAIASPEAVARALRRPSVATLIKLYAEGAIDIRGGTLFDLAANRPRFGAREIIRRLDKIRLARALAPFALRPPYRRRRKPAFSLDSGKAATRGTGSSQGDIAFHYDASNRFYELFLDPQMVYSCGYFRDWSNDLAQAQRDKLDMICRKLRIKPGERLLDIGSGWGSLICHAAERYGATALGVTLSKEQLTYAREQIAQRGLQDRVRVELRDFRDLSGSFDKIASIGMFEHVGIKNHASYFLKIRDLLEPRGLYLHHAIARRGKTSARLFRRKRREYAAMTRFIFPGAEVDHIGMTLTNLEGHGFETHDVENWREHYAKTTALWATRLIANKEAAISEVGEARFRLWTLYLAGVSLAFSRGALQVFQTLASKRTRGPSGLPPTREDLYR